MELTKEEEEHVDNRDELEDPSLVHIGVIGDTVSSGLPSLSFSLSRSFYFSLSLYLSAGGYTGLSAGWHRLSLA